jgi:PAS domain S-box-containing protein
MLITDPEGAIQYVNPHFVKVTGYTAEEAIGRNVNILQSGKHPREFWEELWQTIKAGKMWRGELQNKKKDGTLYHDMVDISPIMDEHSGITYFVGVQTDITDLKGAKEGERQYQAELAHMGRVSVMGELTRTLAHELNQPLTAVVTYTEGLAAQIRSTKGQGPVLLDVLDKSARLAKQAAGVVRNIRDFVGKREVKRQDIDINQTVRAFDAFVTTKRDGLGMGLPIYRTIVAAHGGRIWASTGADQGTTFHVTLLIGAIDHDPAT